MSKRPLRLGELLVQLGRIEPDDVTRALRHQQEHGGYLGDALIHLGVLTREELRWSLADQYDLPFVRLRPDGVDQGLAAMVPAAWAREHLMLPVLRDGERVTVVLGEVTELERLEEVRRMTGAAAVDAALSSPEMIRELIDAVYGPAVLRPVGLSEFLADAVAHHAIALGVSVREDGARGWYRVVETVHRPLKPDWEAELRDAVSPLPPLSAASDPAHRSWPALLRAGEARWWARCAAVGQGRALEWAARLDRVAPLHLLSATLEPGAAEALWQRLHRGPALVQVRAPEEPELREAVERAISLFPTLLLGAGTRSVHVSDRPAACGGGDVPALHLRGALADELRALEMFALRAVTVDVAEASAADARALSTAAELTVIRIRGGEVAGLSPDAEIHLRTGADGLAWSLEPAEHAQD